jgi:hypothetical protein
VLEELHCVNRVMTIWMMRQDEAKDVDCEVIVIAAAEGIYTSSVMVIVACGNCGLNVGLVVRQNADSCIK